MNQIFTINKIWIEFISDFPCEDKYCKRLWETMKWEVSIDDDNCFIIKSVYNYGGKSDDMETWTEPFGTSKRFYKWCNDGKKFLQNKFTKYKIDCYKKKSSSNFTIYFKISEQNIN